MLYYHGTPIKNLPSIKRKGLIPKPNWGSDGRSVVSLANSIKEALMAAYSVDTTKILAKKSMHKKKKPAPAYAVLEVDASNYTIIKHQVDEWWIEQTIDPKNIKVKLIVKFAEAELVWRKFQRNSKVKCKTPAK
ncbi:MAG: hypothetical protein M1338_03195 [Patescibacteria group bacterium]|nr:hypothetical protein [Patescibacteria group bacterium]